ARSRPTETRVNSLNASWSPAIARSTRSRIGPPCCATDLVALQPMSPRRVYLSPKSIVESTSRGTVNVRRLLRRSSAWSPPLERTVRRQASSRTTGGHDGHRYRQARRFRSGLRLHRSRGPEGILLPSEQPRGLARLRPPLGRRACRIRGGAESQGPARQQGARRLRTSRLIQPQPYTGRPGSVMARAD